MPRPRRVIFAAFWLLLLLATTIFAATATAQELPRGPLRDVEIIGTTSYADLVRVILSAKPGSPAERVDLEAERNRVYSLGTFEEVSVSIEDRGEGPVLVVRVKENPRIAEIRFEGVETLPPETLAQALAQENLLEPGRVFNTTRAQEAIATIQRGYRTAGFPFDVPVSLTVTPQPDLAAEGEDPPVTLTFTVNEHEPLERVTFEGATVLSTDELDAIFAPLVSFQQFDFNLYRQAVQEVAARYGELGYRQSGVDLQRSELRNGTLMVRIRELRIVSVDTTAIGVDASALSLGPGDLFNYDVLLEDVRRLAAGRSADVRLVPQVTSNGEVRVRFEVGPPETAGVIDEVVIEGNTVFSDEELLPLLTLGVGDTFTSTLAEEDFRRLTAHYEEAGYLVSRQPNFNYLDGTYVQRLTEIRIAGYRITFDGERDNTKDFVITRELPAPGSVANDNEVLDGLRKVARLGVVQPVGRQYLPTEAPDEVIVEVIVRATRTGLFTPAATFATDTGLSASISFSETNFLGRAHNVSAEITGQSTDIGLMFGGSVRYSVPWLFLDFADFQEVPTSVSASLFSIVQPNQVLSIDGDTTVLFPGAPNRASNRVLVGEYNQRDTGLSFSVGRPIAPDTSIRFAARGSFTEYKLEPPSVECELDNNGNVTNGDVCSLPAAQAARYLPQGGLSSFIGSTVTFDNRDSPEFPREGFNVTGSAGVGLGTDFRNPTTNQQQAYVFEQVEFGVRTYVRVADIDPFITDPNHVLAFRLNGGHQFGGLYPSSRRFRVGKTSLEATAIRGYQLGDFDLSRSYVTGSMEYRYDFGLDTFATQTIIGIVFADLGWASSVPGFDDYATPIFGGVGVGVQVNLGFSGVLLPALRFDYGFSERHPTGEFRFRVGPVF